MAIQGIWWGLEAVEGTAAADFVFLPVVRGSFKPTNTRNRETPNELTGANWGVISTRPTTQQFGFDFQMLMYFDLVCYPLASQMGAPVTAAVSGATGAYTNTFKPGTSPKTATVIYKSVSGGQARWRQATGCRINNSKLTITNTGLPAIEFSAGYGKFAASISAPTVPALAAAAYVQPNTAMQSFTLGGVAWRHVTNLEIDVTMNMTPDWDIYTSADYSRSKMGIPEASMTIGRFYDAYSGSMLEDNETGDGLLAQIIGTVQGTDAIGTGTPTTPRFQFTVPKPWISGANENTTDADDSEEVNIAVGYDATLASGLKYEFRNELASSAFAGS